MAKTTIFEKESWETFHGNGPFPLKKFFITELEGESNMPDKFDRYNDTTREIQRLLQEAAAAGEGFRAIGSRWSLSHIAHQKHRMHYNKGLNLHLPLTDGDMHAQATYDRKNLFFFQCGNTMKEISRTLRMHGKSLKTSGASNGQTIAGCISTGVHGSGIDVGSVQDFVVGLSLIIGPNAEDVMYLERHTKPALNDAFAQQIGSRVIRNDGLFNAALVGLGSFGFVHGVTIEAEDIFLLKRYIKKVNKALALELADTMDFANSAFVIEGETDAQGRGLRPFHYKIYMNPYSDEANYTVEAIYKKPYAVPYPDPIPAIETSVYKDLISVLIKLSEKYPKKIPFFIKQLSKQALPAENKIVTGTLAETFWDAPYKGKAFAISFGVDHTDTSRVLELFGKLAKTEGPIPGLFGLRFVKKSEATLSFARFPITSMIEIDGIWWEKSKKLMSVVEFSRRMIEVLRANGIPFTIHWGKNCDWTFPNLVADMYGPDAVTWRAYRTALLSPEMARVFSNDFLNDAGLSVPVDDAEPGLIASQ
ncbi:MAG: FAD-binding protein [Saprospiraceae bacterium]